MPLDSSKPSLRARFESFRAGLLCSEADAAQLWARGLLVASCNSESLGLHNVTLFGRGRGCTDDSPHTFGLQGVGLRNTEKLSSRRRLGLGRCGGRAGELVTCKGQRTLDLGRVWMRSSENALPRFCDGLERRHGLAEIVERGAFGSEAEHRQLFRESRSARYIFSVTAPARWRGG